MDDCDEQSAGGDTEMYQDMPGLMDGTADTMDGTATEKGSMDGTADTAERVSDTAERLSDTACTRQDIARKKRQKKILRPGNARKRGEPEDSDEDDAEEAARELHKLRRLFSTGKPCEDTDVKDAGMWTLVVVNASSENGEVAKPHVAATAVPTLAVMDVELAEVSNADALAEAEDGENETDSVPDSMECAEWDAPDELDTGQTDRNETDGNETSQCGAAKNFPDISISPPELRMVTLMVNGVPIEVRVLGSSALGGSLKCSFDAANPFGEKPLTKEVAHTRCVLIRRCRIPLNDKISNGQRANAAAVLIITDDRLLDAFSPIAPTKDLIFPPFGAYMCSKDDGNRIIQSIEKGSTIIEGFSLQKDRPISRQAIANFVPRLRCRFCPSDSHTLCGCPNRENYVFVDLPGKFDDGLGTLESVSFGAMRVVNCQNPARAKDVTSRMYPLAKRVPLIPWSSIDRLIAPQRSNDRAMRSAEISHIYQEIYVGGGRNAGNPQTLKQHGIRAVFDCACQYNERYKVEAVCKELGVDYCGIPAMDSPTYPLLQHYEEFERFICKHTKESESYPTETDQHMEDQDQAVNSPVRRILVICVEGVNRSCTLTACYLMLRRKWPLVTIVERLRDRRKVALTNPYFRYLMWSFAIRRNLRIGAQSVSSLHSPIKAWNRFNIMDSSKDLVRLGSKHAPRLLDALREEVPTNDPAAVASWHQNVLYVAHEAIMQRGCKIFRESILRVILSWRLSMEILAPLISIWRRNHMLPEKLLHKFSSTGDSDASKPSSDLTKTDVPTSISEAVEIDGKESIDVEREAL